MQELPTAKTPELSANSAEAMSWLSSLHFCNLLIDVYTLNSNVVAFAVFPLAFASLELDLLRCSLRAVAGKLRSNVWDRLRGICWRTRRQKQKQQIQRCCALSCCCCWRVSEDVQWRWLKTLPATRKRHSARRSRRLRRLECVCALLLSAGRTA